MSNLLIPSKNEDIYRFSIEDTQDTCYRDICSYLQEKGWKRISHRKKSKVEKKFPLKKDEIPLFYWVLNEKDIDYNSILPNQVCNHFEGVARSLTRKSGFCDLLREMEWMGINCYEISPRSYNLGNFFMILI